MLPVVNLSAPLLRDLGRVDYEPTWRAMIDFTAAREPETRDELWVCEHPPVYTLGQAGKAEHLLRDEGIPLVKVDRGGQITYHGPGQAVIYLLLDLNRRGIRIRALVHAVEQSVIDYLAPFGIDAHRLDGAPGVYLGSGNTLAKIGALGLRIRKGCCYHGVSLNVDMDLAPFSAINPCGHAGMRVTQMREFGAVRTSQRAGTELAQHLSQQLALLGSNQ